MANLRGREASSSQSSASLARSEAGKALERSEAMSDECGRKVAEAAGKVRGMEEEVRRVKEECEKRVALITEESRNSALKAVGAAKARLSKSASLRASRCVSDVRAQFLSKLEAQAELREKAEVEVERLREERERVKEEKERIMRAWEEEVRSGESGEERSEELRRRIKSLLSTQL